METVGFVKKQIVYHYRGFLIPELNEHGLRELKAQIPTNCTEGFSTSRTREIGLEKMSGIDFKSVFYLVEEVTR